MEEVIKIDRDSIIVRIEGTYIRKPILSEEEYVKETLRERVDKVRNKHENQ